MAQKLITTVIMDISWQVEIVKGCVCLEGTGQEENHFVRKVYMALAQYCLHRNVSCASTLVCVCDIAYVCVHTCMCVCACVWIYMQELLDCLLGMHTSSMYLIILMLILSLIIRKILWIFNTLLCEIMWWCYMYCMCSNQVIICIKIRSVWVDHWWYMGGLKMLIRPLHMTTTVLHPSLHAWDMYNI